MLAAYLIEPGRSAYVLDDLAAEYGVELVPDAGGRGGDGGARRRGRGAAPARRPDARSASRSAARRELYRDVELPLTRVLAEMETRGVKIDTYRMGEITARLAERVEELEARAYELAGEEFMLGSTQQVARILFEKLGLAAGRKGKTGYSTDAKVLRGIRDEHEIVPVIEEWRELSKLLNTYLGPLPSLISERHGPAAHDDQPDRRRRPDGCRRRTRTCSRSRSAPTSAARSARRSSPRRARSCCRPTTARSSCGSSRTSRASRSCARRSSAARTSTARPPPRCSASTRPS